MEIRPKVIISGFEPFGIHKINASWESVKNISKKELEKDFNVELITVEIPVIYDKVDQIVPNLWKEYNPLLFVHVGVSGLANQLIFETRANASEYLRVDCDGKLPENSMNCCYEGNCSEILCKLDVQKLCKDFNEVSNHVRACTSTNAGRYLCEYIYYTSLSINPLRTLFIHVPELNKPYTAQQVAKSLEEILRLCLLQLENCKCIATTNL